MRTRLLIACTLTLSGCSDTNDDVDLGDLTATGKADFVGFEIPISLSAGKSTPLFHFGSDDEFTVQVIQSTSTAQAKLEAFTPDGSLSSVGKEPSLTIVPSEGGAQSYSVRVTNQSSFQLLNGTLVISAGGGGDPDGDKKTLTLTSYISGPDASSSDAAIQGWQAECDAWRQVQFMLSGPEHIDSYDCGAAVQVGTSQWRYESEPTLVVIATVPAGTEPILGKLSIEGGPASTSAGALAKWRDACNDHFLDQDALWAGRLIAARCPRPNQIGTSQWNYRAESEVYLRALPGTTFPLAGYITGSGASTSDAAIASWKAQCDAWAGKQFDRSGSEHVASYSCGAPVQVGTSLWRYESVTEIVLAVELPAGQNPTTLSQTVEGTSQNTQEAALAAWQTACDQQLDSQATLWGKRFLGGTCTKPTQIGTSQWRYRGPAEVRLLPL